MADQIPILLDTDPGNDIDDALAIGYLLRHPRAELLGITTVTGDVQKRARLAEKICQVSSVEVPIFAGKEGVLIPGLGPGQPGVAQYEAIEGQIETPYPANQAVSFLRDTIRSRPGEITLVSIGPFGNIATLFAVDPEIPWLLKDFVSMAGAFACHDNREWNCIVDPGSTALVARTPKPCQRWVGLDVTLQVVEEADIVRERYKGEPLATILPMAEIWFRHTPNIVYHDPLAVATLFEPSLVRFSKGKVTVNLSDGATTFEEGEGTDWVATEVDAPAYLDHFYDVISLR
ncbi:MAG: nucleoside hydrolase [Fimbriimonadaceae bacterium]|jgi:purine nucleosidase|nr:nucleoside hydrolase [Fimbriimonadaceae bacterium]